jgi:hypothetical protein
VRGNLVLGAVTRGTSNTTSSNDKFPNDNFDIGNLFSNLNIGENTNADVQPPTSLLLRRPMLDRMYFGLPC